MSVITGEVGLTVIKIDGKEETVVVQGSKFGQEDSGPWSQDDDGEWFASFLFIAFFEAFDLMLSFEVCGNKILKYELCVQKKDFEASGILSVKIDEDELEVNVNNLLPSTEGDD